MNIPGHDERIFRTPDDDVCAICNNTGTHECGDCDGNGVIHLDAGSILCPVCKGEYELPCECGAGGDA